MGVFYFAVSAILQNKKHPLARGSSAIIIRFSGE
jgi:hypothetical protein